MQPTPPYGDDSTRAEAATSPNMFPEDVVRLRDDTGSVGLIYETFEQQAEDIESDEEDEHQMLVRGQVSVFWLTGEESVRDEKDLEVVDRQLMHGDVVCWADNPLGQAGHVVGVRLSVDVEASGGRRFAGVPTTALAHIQPLRAGMYVVLGTWLGCIQSVVDAVHVQFDDGSVCKVLGQNQEQLDFEEDKADLFVDEEQCPFFPGQQVFTDDTSVFHNAEWLQGAYRGKREGVVILVEPEELVVDWLAACKFGDQEREAPPTVVGAREVKPFSYFNPTCWELGCRALLRPGLTLAELASLSAAGAAGAAAPEAQAQAAQGAPATAAAGGGRKHDPVLPERAPEAASVRPQAPSAHAPARGRRRRSGGQARERRREARRAASPPDVLQVVMTRTVVDVLWQDGTLSEGVESQRLCPLNLMRDHDLWPNEFVEEVGDDDGDTAAAPAGQAAPPARTGIVRKMDPEARIATVTWLGRRQDGTLEPVTESCATEEVSVYGLRLHQDYQYRIGDVVLRLAPPEDAAEVVGGGGGASTTATAEPALSAAEADETLSWVGEIIGIGPGTLSICCANGTLAEVSPESVFVVSREDDDADVDGDIGDSASEGSSWETVDEDGASEGGDMQGLSEHEHISRQWEAEAQIEAEARMLMGDREDDPDAMEDSLGALPPEPAGVPGSIDGESGEPQEPGAAPGAAASPIGDAAGGNGGSAMAAGFKLLADLRRAWAEPGGIGSMISTVMGEQQDGGQCRDHEPEERPRDGAPEGATAEDSGPSNATDGGQPAGEEVPSAPPPVQAGGEAQPEEAFERYAGVTEATDHSYANEPMQPTDARRWQKRVLKDLKLLSRNLPDTIWVRSYVQHLGLLRAAMLGARGTPYHDNLFFFDVYLPPTYPSTPPEVNFHSHGRRINPNLYEDGKVCLSLLNTWSGNKDEMWNPEESTLLQVLVSIQGLVLVPKPYYNEAGYEKQVGSAEGEKNAALYNENAFLLSCRSMLDTIRRPPQHFEALVRTHFVKAAPTIMSKIDQYLEGKPVGAPPGGHEGGDGCSGENSSGDPSLNEFEMPSSPGFRLMLGKLRPRMLQAFQSLGANL
uniref:Ubiquitin-conjugating enzyme E2 O n=1 Tax=Tetraselmis sp. GSL018 TaxID=582737 RepID=A0A061SDR0_9CHLO|mmetsp:Transcript_18563/g.44380  ORF Transcript_18563/g.44380 Transcript_18563/m.44380 type:complete len:1083 (-) Transcript_18563:103-3351(-)